MKNCKTLLLLSLGSLILFSCAKEKDYETVYKEVELQKRSNFLTTKTETDKDGNVKQVPVKYLYVPMTLGTPREVVTAKPFYQGDEKLVRLEWSEDGLEVIQMEKDERFGDNELNDVPVLTIPGDYMQFQCKEDAYGECSNTEEEDSELTWDRKQFFKPDYKDIDVKEVNMLDLVNVDGDSCVSKLGSKVVDYEVSKGVINVEIEKTYQLKSSWRCIRNNYYDDKLDYNSFKVRFFYSIVELEQVASKNYQAVNYPLTEHDDFGFFKNEKNTLSGEFDSQRLETTYLLNRFNPKRENNELVYYLSKTFNKPKNKAILNATKRSIEIMNIGLAKAKSGFNIKLVEQTGEKEVSPGDLRFNTIVLIDDPLANGLLGYGPSVSNPETGEIVQAHVNMYGGVLKSTVKRVYNEAVDLVAQELSQTELGVQAEGIQLAAGVLTGLPDSLLEGILPNTTIVPEVTVETPEVEATEGSQILNHAARNFGTNLNLTKLSASNVLKAKMFTKESIHQKVNIKKQYARLLDGNFSGKSELEKMSLKKTADEQGLTLSTLHSPEFFPISTIGGTTKTIYPELLKIEGLTNADGTLKRWKLLSSEQQDKILQTILVRSYTATFIHEIGHNLGLRHNFIGSYDKENFFTEDEAKDLGMHASPAYSSVMDYSASEFNQMAALGKYDIAAIRFAYGREIVLTNGDAVPVTTDFESTISKITTDLKSMTDKAEIANANKKISALVTKIAEVDAAKANSEPLAYLFCTDENAGLSAICNRFDEGTSLTEIATYRTSYYDRVWKYRNLRDDKDQFNTYGITSYLIARHREFGRVRDIVEDYERFLEFFPKELMEAGCSPAQQQGNPDICGMINDRKDSLLKVADMFINILKTPDHLCAVIDKTNPGVVVGYEKLAELNSNIRPVNVITSCFDSQVAKEVAKENPNLEVLGENGRFLNSVRDQNPNYKYSSDRAARGIWADKIMAFRFLHQRRWRNSSSDKNFMALVDHPIVKAKVDNIVKHMVLGSPLDEPTPFKMQSGKTFQLPYIIGNEYKIDQIEDGIAWLKDYLGMDQSGTGNLSEIMLNQLSYVGVQYGEEGTDAAYAQNNSLTLRKYDGVVTSPSPSSIYFYDDFSDTTYSAGKINTMGTYVLNSINSKAKLDEATAEEVKTVLENRINPKAPADMSIEHTAYFNLEKDWQVTLVNIAAQGQEVPEAAFVATFGEEQGPLLFKVFSEGATVMTGIQELIITISQTVPADANENVVMLYATNLETLKEYAEGKLSDELVTFFKKQLKRLPSHQMYPNF